MPKLADFHFDALREIVNTGVGKAASALNEMLESHIELEVPTIRELDFEEMDRGPEGLGSSEVSCVQLGFHGAFVGSAALVFPPQSAVKLVAALTGEDPETPSLNAVMAGTLNEVGNIVINGVIGTIGNITDRPFEFSLPNYIECRLKDLLQGSDKDSVTILLVQTHFRVEDLQIDGNIFLVFELGTFDVFLSLIDGLCQTI